MQLEVVLDLVTETILAGLRRFAARRLKPCVICSDNVTNFKATWSFLNPFSLFFQIFASNEIQRFNLKKK